MRIAHHSQSAVAGNDGPARLTVGQIRRRALLVSASWWLAAAVVYVLVAFSFAGAPLGCGGIQGLTTRGMLLAMGGLIGLPVMLIGMALSAAVIAALSRSARSGVVLGTLVAGAEIGVVLALATTFALTSI
jgi:hypothetical protein